MSELYDKHQTVAHEQIDATREYLRRSSVSLNLGEVAVARMVSLANRLYVPEVVDGIITPEGDGIPVVSLRTGEAITQASGLSTEQQGVIAHVSNNARVDFEHLNLLLQPHTIKLPRQAVGLTMTQKADLDIGPAGYELRGSPAIVLNNQKVTLGGYTSTTLPHELVHAGQTLVRPVRRKADHSFMKEEAQAYNIQSKILTGLGGGFESKNTHLISRAYELWKQKGLSLDTEDDVRAFSEMLEELGIPAIHPKQRRKTA